ncbi:hypothetical protein [Bacillus atrophaeus]|uniref:hypothetical protein n=1 Tax=Bacillus atrophaeus TaxID=1452 RepID=UPI002E1EBEB4|nr:hypothetical protein [Bacillus atrophaeus]
MSKSQVMFNYDSGSLIVAGYCTVEQFAPNVFTVKLNEAVSDDGEQLVNAVVSGKKIYGKGSKKFKKSIMDAIDRFKAEEKLPNVV